MAKRTTENLSWTDVDIATLPKKAAQLYKQFKQKSQEAREAREAFDDEFVKQLSSKVNWDQDNQSVKISHHFGKLSFAVSDTPAVPKAQRGRGFSF